MVLRGPITSVVVQVVVSITTGRARNCDSPTSEVLSTSAIGFTDGGIMYISPAVASLKETVVSEGLVSSLDSSP
jgi:hypothetical protein